MTFEYKSGSGTDPGQKVKGLRTTADRFAHALSEVMNAQAAEGWEYLRTDTLPAEERTGLTGRTTVFQNMLVFRRAAEAARPVAVAAADVPARSNRAPPNAAWRRPAQAMPEAPRCPRRRSKRRNVAAE